MDTFPILHCRDLDRSLRFYRDEFGFTLKFRWPQDGSLEFAYLERDGSGLGLGRPNGEGYGLPVSTGLPATFVLCTYVDDLDRLYAKLQTHGVRGLAAPAGDALHTRPLVVKVANDPAARPQSGMAQADLVLEIPVEGGITRYALVFQSQDPAKVGPVRSARQSDLNYLSALHAILAHVG